MKIPSALIAMAIILFSSCAERRYAYLLKKGNSAIVQKGTMRQSNSEKQLSKSDSVVMAAREMISEQLSDSAIGNTFPEMAAKGPVKKRALPLRISNIGQLVSVNPWFQDNLSKRALSENRKRWARQEEVSKFPHQLPTALNYFDDNGWGLIQIWIGAISFLVLAVQTGIPPLVYLALILLAAVLLFTIILLLVKLLGRNKDKKIRPWDEDYS